jgi:glycosyltransferase involved in cell wall biosynthesis
MSHAADLECLVSAVIPAYREEERIGATVHELRIALGAWAAQRGEAEVLVVDDGSPDRTGAVAEEAGARVLRLPRNRGKGGALAAGLAAARGRWLLLLDADTGATAPEALKLLAPVVAGEADMTVATFPPQPGGGFGFVRRLAAWGLARSGAPPMQAPLSGQRALSRAAWERLGRLDPGFGIEMGLNLDAARAGLRVLEVPTLMAHRVTFRDVAGFLHRARQFRDVLRAILARPPGKTG